MRKETKLLRLVNNGIAEGRKLPTYDVFLQDGGTKVCNISWSKTKKGFAPFYEPLFYPPSKFIDRDVRLFVQDMMLQLQGDSGYSGGSQKRYGKRTDRLW